jgi:hypothetical protein
MGIVRVLGFRNEHRHDWRVLIELASGRDSPGRAMEGGLVIRLAHYAETAVGRQSIGASK